MVSLRNENMVMRKNLKSEYVVKRIGGYLHRVYPIVDSTGKVISHAIKPLMVELKLRDIMQIVVGASILAIPVGFTEETWQLGERLPVKNILMLAFISITFIAAFVYLNFYRFHLRNHVFNYVMRVIAIYCLSLVVVGSLLTVIDKCPWGIDNLLAMKRIIIVAFPASMSASVTDVLK